MKKIIIVCGGVLLLWGASAECAQKWEKVRGEKVLDNQHLQLEDGRVIQFMGIKAPQKFLDECYARSTYRMLLLLLERETLRLKIHSESERVYKGEIKIEGKYDLSEFLLFHGGGRYVSEERLSKRKNNALKKAEKKAKDQKRGLWGRCGVDQWAPVRKKAGRRAMQFRKAYGQYLAPISVGKVVSVLSGNGFLLENGLAIELLGVAEGQEGSCMEEQGRQHLSSLVNGERVFLVKDRRVTDAFAPLKRYVFIPKTKKKPQKFINQQIITDGFGLFDEESDTLYFAEELKEAQNRQFYDPSGGGVRCFNSEKE